jgi:hypothetical protein
MRVDDRCESRDLHRFLPETDGRPNLTLSQV